MILLRLAVFAAAAAQLVVPYIVNPFRDGQDAVRAGAPSQVEPAAYAFAIWGPIYLLALAYAIWQLLPAGRRDPMTARIAPFALPLYLGSSVWLLAADEQLPLWLTMPILAAMACCAIAALWLSLRSETPTLSRVLFLTLPFGLYAGWTTCATFVNVAEVAPQYGFDRFGLDTPIYAAVSIAAATLAAGFVLIRARGAITYALPVAWALTAIIIAAQTRAYDQIVLYAAAAALTAVIAIAALSKLRARSA